MRACLIVLMVLVLAGVAHAGDGLNLNLGSRAQAPQCRVGCPNYTLLGVAQLGGGVLRGTPPTGISRLMQWSPSALTMTRSSTLSLIDFAPVIAVSNNTPNLQALRLGGTVTNSVAPVLYTFDAVKMNTVFDTSAAVKPFLPDTFFDATTIQNTGGAATESAYASISLLSQRTYNAIGGDFTFDKSTAQEIGLYWQPSFTAALGTTFSMAHAAAVYVNDPGIGGAGTVSITDFGGLSVDDLTDSRLATRYVVRSAMLAGSGKYFLYDIGGAATKLNNVDYTWPATQGAAGSNLQNNGAGALTWSTSNKYALATTIEAGGGL